MLNQFKTQVCSGLMNRVGGGLLAVTLFTSAVPLVAAPTGAKAENLTTQQIIDGLKLRKTRGLSAAPALETSAEERAAIARMRGQTRALSRDDREQIAEIAPKRPRLDLQVNFEYNSATLSERAEPQLHSLGQALTRAELAGSVFLLGGHTDAKGGEEYNQELSERRAETVKRFLIVNYRIAPDSLMTAGYGKRDLRNGSNPFSAENRRVEVVNVAGREEASR